MHTKLFISWIRLRTKQFPKSRPEKKAQGTQGTEEAQGREQERERKREEHKQQTLTIMRNIEALHEMTLFYHIYSTMKAPNSSIWAVWIMFIDPVSEFSYDAGE